MFDTCANNCALCKDPGDTVSTTGLFGKLSYSSTLGGCVPGPRGRVPMINLFGHSTCRITLLVHTHTQTHTHTQVVCLSSMNESWERQKSGHDTQTNTVGTFDLCHIC